MSACPQPADLDRWMREALDAPSAENVQSHVLGCESCRLRIDQLRSTINKPVPLALRRRPSNPATPKVASDDSRTLPGVPAHVPTVAHRAEPPTAKAAVVSQIRQPGEMLGRFVILACIGEGGMGVVYAAYDPELDRKVAIKLMRSDVAGPSADDMRTRLLREAQAMARLSHPNVIPVYDVGTVEGRVFVAMEFVDGKTLLDHLRETKSWKEIVALYVLAGKGLAAAHAAGLIHRDFKPQNVLVSSDGQVRVLDFGLARPSGEIESAAPVPKEQAVPPGSRSPSGRPLLATPLTATGVMMGTPAYMSLEQFEAGAIDATTDQFSFCVALFEALYGIRPYDGETVLQIVDTMRAGKINLPPRSAKVPSRFYKILCRGLAANAADRFASMDALLTELQRDPSAVTRRVLSVAAVLLAIVAAAAGSLVLNRQQKTLCTGAQARWNGAWDDDRKEALMRAFVGTGVPYATNVFATVRGMLDGYSAAWVKMRTEACEATRIRGEQSERLLDLRMHCLDRKLTEAGALLNELGAADAKVIDQAVPAVQSLGGLTECADPIALGAAPNVLSAAAQRQVDQAYAKLAEAKAVAAARDPARALDIAVAAAALAQQSGQLPAVTETRLLVADLRGKRGEDLRAEEELLAAVISADGAGRDDLRAQALTELSLAVFRLGRPTEALSFGQLANAALARAGGNDAVQARLHHILALIFHQLGRPDDAAAHFGKCLALRQKAFGADSYMAARSMQAFGSTLHEEGKLDEAVTHLRNALALQIKAVGEGHPDVALTRQALGSALSARGNFPEALTELRAAVDTLTKSPEHDALLIGGARAELARTLAASGDQPAAIVEQQIVLATYGAALSAKHPSNAQAQIDLALFQLDSGDAKLSLASIRKADALLDVDTSPPGLVARAALIEAKSLWATGKKAAAREHAKAVLPKLGMRAPKEQAVRSLADWLDTAR
jgi:tetratricopeptide (TPR) repeat protein/predicted Ser/Thr protein kinase